MNGICVVVNSLHSIVNVRSPTIKNVAVAASAQKVALQLVMLAGYCGWLLTMAEIGRCRGT